MLQHFPTFSAWALFAGNVFAVMVYFVLIALILRPGGFLGRASLPPSVAALACSFLFVCATSSLNMATHAYLGFPLIYSNGQVDLIYLVTEGLKPLILIIWIFVAARTPAPLPYVLVRPDTDDEAT